jgi:hypothetical protein
VRRFLLFSFALVACGTRPPAEHFVFDAGSGGASNADSAPPVCRLSSDPSLDGGADSGPPCGDVPVAIFQQNCSGGICHQPGTGPTPAANLDLVSPCVADRLVSVVSTCNGELLVDPDHPSASFLLEKLDTLKPECGGASMPYGNLLPPKELACVRRWVNAIVRESKAPIPDASSDANDASDANHEGHDASDASDASLD